MHKGIKYSRVMQKKVLRYIHSGYYTYIDSLSKTEAIKKYSAYVVCKHLRVVHSSFLRKRLERKLSNLCHISRLHRYVDEKRELALK